MSGYYYDKGFWFTHNEMTTIEFTICYLIFTIFYSVEMLKY